MANDGVLVTGGGGFMGHALVAAEAARGAAVRSLDPHHPRPCPAGTVERIDGSILDADLARALDGVSVVYHLASAHLEVKEGEAYFRRVNVDGTRHLLEAAADAGVQRVVHVSTVGVYGLMSDVRFDEASPTEPTIAYERTKLEGEDAARAVAEARGFELVVLRPSWVFGPDCGRTQKIFRAIRKRRFPRIGACRAGRDGIYIDDAVSGMQLAASHPAAPGETFILASGDAPTIAEWIDAIAEAQGVAPPRVRLPIAVMYPVGLAAELAFKAIGRDAPFSRRSIKFYTNGTVFDASKIRDRLGFDCAVGWRDGVRRTAEALR